MKSCNRATGSRRLLETRSSWNQEGSAQKSTLTGTTVNRHCIRWGTSSHHQRQPRAFLLSGCGASLVAAPASLRPSADSSDPSFSSSRELLSLVLGHYRRVTIVQPFSSYRKFSLPGSQTLSPSTPTFYRNRNRFHPSIEPTRLVPRGWDSRPSRRSYSADQRGRPHDPER